MSTHDEESAPLEETQASDEPGELEAGEASAEESFDTAAVASEQSAIAEEVEHAEQLPGGRADAGGGGGNRDHGGGHGVPGGPARTAEGPRRHRVTVCDRRFGGRSTGGAPTAKGTGAP